MYYDKLAGTSFRQKEIDALTGDEDLRLIAEPDNKYDASAVRCEANGVLIGYIPKGHNKEICDTILRGGEVKIDEWTITGGVDGKNYGVNVHIVMPVEAQLKRMKEVKPVYGDGIVLFDEKNHHYFNENGERMLSGSTFEESQVNSPDLSFAAKGLARSTGIDQHTIEEWWDFHGEMSRDLGTIVHRSLEFYINNRVELDTYMRVRETTDKGMANFLPVSIANIVGDYLKFNKEGVANAEAEVFVRYGNECGFIDQLRHNADGTLSIIDYKITKGISKVKTNDFGTIQKYTLQQNFYRSILEANGEIVRDMTLHVYNGDKWSGVSLKRLDLSKVIGDFKCQ